MPRGHWAAALLASQIVVSTGTAAEVDGAQGPFLSIAYTLSAESDFDAAATGTLSVKETRIAAGLLPKTTASGHGLDVGIDYQYTRYGYDGIASRNRDLHRLQVPFGLRANGDEYYVDAFLAPGIATSSNAFKDPFGRLSGDDLFTTARLESGYGRRRPVTWLAGLAWDRSFGEPRLYPIIGWQYKPSPRLRARIAFPDPALQVAIGGRQALGLRLYPAGFQWHVLDDDLVTEFDYRVEAWRAELTWSLRAWRSMVIDLTAGYEFARRHELTDRTGMRIASDPDDAFLLTAGLRWRDGPVPQTHRVAHSSDP